MDRILQIILFLLFFSGFNNIVAKQSPILLEDVKGYKSIATEPLYGVLTTKLLSMLKYEHVNKISINNTFMHAVLEHYLNRLDPYHELFLRSDAEYFEKNIQHFYNAFLKDDLTFVYFIFNKAQQRLLQQYSYTLMKLATPIILNSDETILKDSSQTLWAKDENELKNRWFLRIKLQYLQHILHVNDNEIVIRKLKRYYQQLIKKALRQNSETVFASFINTILKEIDPHSEFLPTTKFTEFQQRLNNYIEGIGVKLKQVENEIVVESVIPGGPAAKSQKISSGDKILAVGQQHREMINSFEYDFEEFIEQIKGASGSIVKLKIQPISGQQNSKIVNLVRDKIHIEDQKAKINLKKINHKTIAVLTIPLFYNHLAEDVKAELARYNNESISALIIDLRNNSGGSLDEAVKLTDLFIGTGPVTQIRNRSQRSRVLKAVRQHYYSAPLVVLINKLSASASEIFAAAIQDYREGIIVGEPSFGKATVQVLKPLVMKMLNPNTGNNTSSLFLGGIKYTTEKYYRVTGESTQSKGVIPDIYLPSVLEVMLKGEQTLEHALVADITSPVPYKPSNKISTLLPQLISLSHQRVINSADFKSIKEEIKSYIKNKQKNRVISLHLEKQRLQQKAQAESNSTTNNTLLADPIEKNQFTFSQQLTDKKKDPYLEEALQIALDFVKLQK